MIPYTRKGGLILQYNLYDHMFKKKIIENNENANLFEQVRNSIFFSIQTIHAQGRNI